MKDLAPEIFRKRLLVEGYYSIDISVDTIKRYFAFITSELELRTYGDATIHATSGTGKDINQGFDGFIPLIDSGIYIGVWANKKFLSLIIYTCKDFKEKKAVDKTSEFFKFNEFEYKVF